jgi:aldose 1-epimerase
MGAATASASGSVTKDSFGKTKDGTPVEIFTLKNSKGSEARICNYGATVVSLKVPDRTGRFDDIVLGCNTLDDYLKGTPYFGCIVGRYGNRIAKGKFTLDDKEYSLPVNNPPNTLHGGIKGFDKMVWDAKPLNSSAGPAVEFHYLSKDGEEGFPGNLSATVVYTLTESNELKVDITATTDKPTVVNLTHHSYFNLAGKGDILGHEVMIAADKFTPADENLIPTGELRSVEGTPMDFRKPTLVGARIDQKDEQLQRGKGYDHNWVFNKPAGQLGLMARVTDPGSGRVMEVLSTEPATQFYTGNHLDGTITGKGGWVYKPRNALCFEPQHFPDSPNHPSFPTTVLRPGQTYRSTIIYRFSINK